MFITGLLELAMFFSVMLIAEYIFSRKLFCWFSGVAFAGWVGILVSFALISRTPVTELRVNTMLFQNVSFYSFWENILVFIPYVYLTTGAFPFTGEIRAVLGGISISTLVEVLQLLTYRGVCDINDIAANGLGVVIGAVLCVVLREKVIHRMTAIGAELNAKRRRLDEQF